MKLLLSSVLVLTLALASQSFSGSTVQAAPIYVTPTSVSYVGGVFSPAINMINGSSLTGGAPYTGVTHDAGNDGTSFKGPAGDVTTNPLDFDLGGSFALTDVLLWNYTNGNGYENRDARFIDISLSTDGVSYTPHSTIELANSASSSEALQTFSLAGTATHVRLQITSSWGDNETGLGEVRFAADDAPVPEPSTFALAALGLVGLGWFGIRRRNK